MWLTQPRAANPYPLGLQQKLRFVVHRASDVHGFDKDSKQWSRTDLGKCIHQYDEKQGNSSTRALSTKIVFFGCNKMDTHKPKKIFFVGIARVLFNCFSSYTFPRSVLFSHPHPHPHPHQQLFTHTEQWSAVFAQKRSGHSPTTERTKNKFVLDSVNLQHSVCR